MTQQEFEVMNKLVEAHNLFVALPVQHPDDNHEWRTKIHDLQRILMARDAVRNHPFQFVNMSPEKK
jgi:hypothetical protein